MKAMVLYIGLLVSIFCQENMASNFLIRYDQNNSGASPSLLPASPKLAWIFESESKIESTALITKDKVYVSTMSGEVICLELATGKKIWTFTSTAPFTASPSLIHGMVFIGDEDGICYCLDSSGKKMWEFACEDKIVAAINFYKDKIIFGSYDHHLYCLDFNGKLQWKIETEAPIHGMCTIIENRGVIAGCDGFIRLIDLETGKEVSSFDGKSYFAASPAAQNKKIVVGSLNGDYYAVSFPEAKLLWEITKKQNKGECHGSAAIFENTVIFPSKKRVLFALRVADGKEIWQYKTKSRIETSPVIAEQKVIFTEFSGIIHILNLATGNSEWKYETGSHILSSPAVREGHIVITCEDGSIQAFK